MAFDRPVFLLFLALPALLWWLLRPPGQGRPWLTYRMELWLRAARELGLLDPRTSTVRSLPLILAGLALAVAAAGPRWGGVEGPDRLLVLLDRSPSMGALDALGHTRLERALDLLAAELQSLPPDVEIRVLQAGGERLDLEGGRAGARASWWPRVAGLGPAASGRAGLPDLVVGLEARQAPVLVLTDLAGPERALAAHTGPARLRVVGEPVDNGALLDLLVAHSWPAPEVDATARVRPGGGERSLVVRAHPSGELLVQVPVASSHEAHLPVDVPLAWPRRSGPVEIRLEPPDPFALDDALRFTPLASPSLRVAVKAGTPGEEPSSLARAAAHALATGEGRVVPEGEDPDLVIVEGGRIPSWPDRSRPDWLLLGTAVSGATADRLLEAPDPGVWESGHPLLSGLDLSQIGVDRALDLAPGLGPGRALFQTASGQPLLLASDAAPRIVHLLFLPQGSSLGAELLWPRFLHRCLAWFTRAGDEQSQALRPGGAAPDLEESELESGPRPVERPLPAFGRPGRDLSAALLLAALAAIALWLLLLAPRPPGARLPFSAPRG